MLKRMIPLVGALVLTVALVTGCQDSLTNTPSSSSITSGSSDKYSIYPISSTPSALESIDAIANDPSIMPPAPTGPGDDGRGGGRDTTHRGGGDTLHHGGDTANHGGGDTLRHGGEGGDSLHQGGRGRGPGGPGGPGGRGGDDSTHHGDTTHPNGDTNRPHPPVDDLGRALQALHLTPAQDSAVRGCLHDLNDCIHADELRHRAALQGLRDSLQADLRAIRDAVQSGRITRDQGKRLADSTVDSYRTRAQAIDAAFKRAYDECWHQFDLCVRGNLTPDQIVIWDRVFHAPHR
ncbi:MAG: hypothetical protein JST22_11800 [Bacteroidetes bacterium]|nr:hypothetical protein [Bacteroidota bacterium]